MADDFTFEITESLGLISEGKGGWTLELNKVSWGGRPAKYDIRTWAPDHDKMGKGVTFTEEELRKLKEILDSLDIAG
ncbi:MAG: YdbC family protein [Treponema sp.]|uniref:YdbC family protein n=1 Tax=Treponema sp. TaxID=166 RepID=UPI00298E8B01|nr:YdbC family protein [Treponema sp.]MCR5386629.1 YdbC family protein [Treponema sp.]